MPPVFSLPFELPEGFILYSSPADDSEFVEGCLKVFINRPFIYNYRFSPGLDTHTLSCNIPPDECYWYTRWLEVACRTPPGDVLIRGWFDFHVPEASGFDECTLFPSPTYPGYWECEEYTGLFARELVWYDDDESEEQIVFFELTDEEVIHLAERVEYNRVQERIHSTFRYLMDHDN
jgi:hypothetical protein